MQHNLSLTPAMQAVLDALRELGQGNANELADKSGKAISTVHRALKTFADAGLISQVDTGADPADDTPTQWTLAEGILADDTDLITDTDLGDDMAGGEEADTDTDSDVEPADEELEPDDDSDDSDAGDDSDSDSDEADGDDSDDDEDPDGEDPDGESDEADDQDPDNGEDDQDEDNGEDDQDEDDGGTVTVVQPSRPGDRKVMTIKAVLSEHGDDGATLDQIVAESGIGHPTASRLLTAMEQADAARCLPGRPQRWVAGPTKASEVDPNPEPPRCVLCFQVIKGMSESPEAVAQVKSLVRPDGTLHVVAEDGTVHTVTLPKRTPTRTPGFATAGVRRTDVTVNADGSQPFAKGELEKLTMSIFEANPGREMTPQEIATAISAQLGGREVSSGAVRNNCGKLGAANRIVMVSDSPWRFVLPVQTEDADADQADDTAAEQS